MRKEYIANKRLNEIFKFEINELMKRKIQKVKSTLNFKNSDIFINVQKPQLTNLSINKKSNQIFNFNNENFINYRFIYFKPKKFEFRSMHK